ncbi:ATP-binding protein [Bradyrhizobium sp. th.b2]|uniref:ATP-binding protein n=1 Tax=Bradyrhizobium sp. th-b2 TaxID=172088 RepID=UPI0004058FF4|nr:ATP-binding protein [Bradyrhizobium sp. th.b2]
MQLGMKDHVDVATGVQDEIKIAFEANAVAFYAQISGLAKDKKRYPIRELSTNAWDASRGDFEVHLPTPLNPVFRVRDYGPGMSHHQMVNVYARLYASTKRATNEQVGGWGLGSKSPFAYLIGDTGAGSYYVTSYHDGVMRAYVLSLAPDGAPVMRLMAETPTEERNGLDVSFAVRREDIQDFHRGAHDILWSFEPRPKIFPRDAVNWKDPVVESQGENWAKFEGNSVPFYGPRVRMGCVMYPFDLRQIESTGFLDDSDEVLFDAPIGSLKVTLSREELAYDDTTRTTLKNLVKQYEDNFIDQLRDKVDAAETLFAAAKVFEEETDMLGRTRQQKLRDIVRWRDFYISEVLAKVNCKMDMLPEGWTEFEKFEDCTVRTNWAADAKIVIEHNPSYSLSRFHMAELVGKQVLWVRCKRFNREQVLAALGNPEAIELDSFKVPVAKRVSKTIRKRKTLVVTTGGRLHALTQDVDMAEGGLMVEAYPGTYRRRRGSSSFLKLHSHQEGSISQNEAESFMMAAVEFGLIEVGTVILVKNYDQEVSGDWTMVADDMIEDIRGRVNVEEFTGLHKKTLHNLNHNLQEVAKMRIQRAPADVREFLTNLKQLYAALQNGSNATTESDKAFAALRRIGINIDKPEVVCPIGQIDQAYERLCQDYPLLRGIVEAYDYSNRNRDKTSKLNHYFELLSRPAVANDNDESEDDLELDQAA